MQELSERWTTVRSVSTPSLVWRCRTGLINCRLFLPECQAEDDSRCGKAGIPQEARTHKSWPRPALEMLKADIDAGVRFGQVGGDGLYGHGYELNYAVEDMGMTFLFDVHSDQTFYEREPEIFIPERKPGPGRTPTLPRTEAETVTVKDYRTKPDETRWEKIEVRDTTKGKQKLSVHVSQVWVWDEKVDQAGKRTLVISRNHAEGVQHSEGRIRSERPAMAVIVSPSQRKITKVRAKARLTNAKPKRTVKRKRRKVRKGRPKSIINTK